jgi:S-adenosylmethionine:tRNA ribosyltransferase-isomerase
LPPPPPNGLSELTIPATIPRAEMETERFNYELPDELIAQRPTARREESRLFHYDRATGVRGHTTFSNILQFLRGGDLLVFNDTKVIPARFHGFKEDTGGKVELLLLEPAGDDEWWSMLKPGKRLRPGSTVRLLNHHAELSNVTVTIIEKNDEGHGRIRFNDGVNILERAEELGEMPLPPYIHPDEQRAALDLTRYQTVFAREPGSVAAPTAGLHYSDELLSAIRAAGVETCFVTLQVGLGTFAPVKTEVITDHKMHTEQFTLSQDTVSAITAAKADGRRVIAVGTTSMRVLETVAQRNDGNLVAGTDRSNIFIYPPYSPRIVDALTTNFHLPKSTLLMLVSAILSPGNTDGIDIAKSLYTEAIAKRYRFFSYGDGMLIT